MRKRRTNRNLKLVVSDNIHVYSSSDTMKHVNDTRVLETNVTVIIMSERERERDESKQKIATDSVHMECLKSSNNEEKEPVPNARGKPSQPFNSP